MKAHLLQGPSRRIRAVVTALVAVLAAVVVPGQAAASPYVVYEVYRASPRAGAQVQVRIEARNGGKPGFYLRSVLRPARHGYESHSFGITEYQSPGRWVRTYGWPAAPQPCPELGVCEPGRTPAVIGGTRTFRPAAGHRIIVAGVRGHLHVTALSPSWRVRPIALGLRVVTTDQADVTGASAAGTTVEHFRAAASAAGPYGSAAFADIPCAVGAASLVSDTGDGRKDFDCGARPLGMGFAETATGRRWSLTGSTAGTHGLPYRLVVLDYPKPGLS